MNFSATVDKTERLGRPERTSMSSEHSAWLSEINHLAPGSDHRIPRRRGGADGGPKITHKRYIIRFWAAI